MQTPSRSMENRNVLIVDDSVQITALLEEVFSGFGARVSVVNNGSDAMMRLQLGSYDLILLDLVMPSPNGWDVLGFIREALPTMLGRTILLTGDRYHHWQLPQLDDTNVRVIYKPFDLGALKSQACELLHGGTSYHVA